MNRPRILLVINTLMNGGAQRQLVVLAREMARSGANVGIFHYGKSDAMARMLAGENVAVHTMQRSSAPRALVAIRAALTIWKMKPQAVISFIDSSNIVAGVAAAALRVAWVPSERNLSLDPPTLKERFWRGVLYRFARSITCNSHAQLRWMQTHFPLLGGRVCYVGNAVAAEYLDTPVSSPSTEDGRCRFLVLGRVADQKDPWTLLKSLELLTPEARASICVDWYGDDDPGAPGLRARLEAAAAQAKLPIRFHDSVSDVISLIDSCTALILCSRFEGTPNVVLEAMARGRPVLASDVSDVPLILGNGTRGTLFRAGSAADLAAAIDGFLSASAHARAAQVVDARAYITESHAVASIAKSYMALLGMAELA